MKGKTGDKAVRANFGAAIQKDAHDRHDAFKKGGAVKKKKKDVDYVDSKMPMHRLDKPRRAAGGSVVKNTGSPFSVASRVSPERS
ncbi:hypothetical protein [Ancylobacter sp.]|uniref:hypothetical protein n=1 Tax=Ancylobacter sp. TaxID=1872567 RepID=UPI003BA8B18D